MQLGAGCTHVTCTCPQSGPEYQGIFGQSQLLLNQNIQLVTCSGHVASREEHSHVVPQQTCLQSVHKHQHCTTTNTKNTTYVDVQLKCDGGLQWWTVEAARDGHQQ